MCDFGQRFTLLATMNSPGIKLPKCRNGDFSFFALDIMKRDPFEQQELTISFIAALNWGGGPCEVVQSFLMNCLQSAETDAGRTSILNMSDKVGKLLR